MSDAPNKIDRANCGPDIPAKLPSQSPSNFQLLRIDLVILTCLAGCLLWDRLMYAAGYRIISDLRLYGPCAVLGGLVLTILLLVRLARSRRSGLTLAGIRILVLFVVALYLMTRFQQEDPFMVGFRERMRASITPQELQTWATAIIPDKTPEEGDLIHLPNGKVIRLTRDDVVSTGGGGGACFSLPPVSMPESIKRLKPEDRPGILVWWNADPSRRHVELMFGRRWGLSVGSSAFRGRTNDEWIPGVYFCSAPD